MFVAYFTDTNESGGVGCGAYLSAAHARTDPHTAWRMNNLRDMFFFRKHPPPLTPTSPESVENFFCLFFFHGNGGKFLFVFWLINI